MIVLETLRDIARPVDALLAWRRALARGGAVVLADEKVADRFTAPGDETERFMYGFSVLHCLPSSMAAPDSATLGTVLRAATCTSSPPTAGFGRCAEIDVDAGLLRIYGSPVDYPSIPPAPSAHRPPTTSVANPVSSSSTRITISCTPEAAPSWSRYQRDYSLKPSAQRLALERLEQ